MLARGAFGGSMSVAFYLDSQKQGVIDSDRAVASLPRAVQISHGTEKSTNTVDFPNKYLLSAVACSDINTMAHIFDISLPIYHQGLIALTRDAQQLLEVVYREGNIQLLLATRAGKHESVDFLLRCGANLLHQNFAFDNAAQLAIANKYWRCVLALIIKSAALLPGFSEAKIPNTERQLLECIYLRQKYTEMLKQGDIKEVPQAVESRFL